MAASYEVPRGHAGQTVEVIRHVLDGHLSILHEGRLVRLAELDPQANATGRRGKDGLPVATEGIPTTAATEAFGQDVGPVTGPDGGFSDHEPDQTEP